MAPCTSNLREIRTRLGLSQAECATALDVAVETFRAWDAGRRPAPEAIVRQARTLQANRPMHDRAPLQVQPTAVGRQGRRSRQGRGLPVGNRKTKALARVLVADRTPAMPS